MKPITIAERLRPFSHKPGASCLLPGTWWSIQAFPTRLRFSHKNEQIDCALEITGPVEQFTLQQDLERRSVWVFGRAKEGYFRLQIAATHGALTICANKTPPGGLITSLGTVAPKETLSIPMQFAFCEPPHIERLSLGYHKEQLFEAISQRKDLKELIPFLFYLAQLTPQAALPTPFFPEDKKEALSQIANFFQVHCDEMLVPRLVDERHQGIQKIFWGLEEEPCAIFCEAAQWIRSLFVQVEDSSIHLLPSLPKELDCGRLLGVAAGSMGTLDIEWSKSQLRRVFFKARTSGQLQWILPNGCQLLRVRTNRLEKGYYQKTSQPFMVKAGTTYCLDRFQECLI